MFHFVPDLIWRLRTPKGQDERAEMCVFIASVQELRETLQVFSQTTWAPGTTSDPSCITEGRSGCEHWRGGGQSAMRCRARAMAYFLFTPDFLPRMRCILLRRAPASDQDGSEVYFVGGGGEQGPQLVNFTALACWLNWKPISCAVVLEPLVPSNTSNNRKQLKRIFK